jgi:hypothetical protein
MLEGNAPTESDFCPNNLVGFSRHLANHHGSHFGGRSWIYFSLRKSPFWKARRRTRPAVPVEKD